MKPYYEQCRDNDLPRRCGMNNLSLIEWQNLLCELRRLLERYGFSAIEEAVNYLEIEK